MTHMKPASLFTLLLLLVLSGCGGPPKLMPTPNVYARGDFDPFAQVPPHFQNNAVDVIYLTDREREDKKNGEINYGYKRSRSVAYGIARVEFGKNVTWEQLVEASRSSKRKVNLAMRVTGTTEMGRFPPTPKTLVELHPTGIPDTHPTTGPATLLADYDQTIAAGEKLLSDQLALTPVKDVYVFVHGYNNTFYDSVTTIAQLWHFFGRQGVPVAYTWPAGHGGLLKGYTYDRESSEFTVYHLKQMIRRIAENPDVGKIHIIAHSRGTDVAISALRELHLEFSGGGKSTRDVLKLGNLVLAAPDVDFDVLVQRTVTARLGIVPENTAVYVCSHDKALGISNWLFGGMMRLGKINPNVFTREELEAMRKVKTVQIIDAQISNAGAFGHDYFHSNPAVSSDLVLLMRYHLGPGAENGRPLSIKGDGFWIINDKYPTPATTQPAVEPAP